MQDAVYMQPNRQHCGDQRRDHSPNVQRRKVKSRDVVYDVVV